MALHEQGLFYLIEGTCLSKVYPLVVCPLFTPEVPHSAGLFHFSQEKKMTQEDRIANLRQQGFRPKQIKQILDAVGHPSSEDQVWRIYLALPGLHLKVPSGV